MNITLLNRKNGVNYSIERVFETIFDNMVKKVDVNRKYVNYYRINFAGVIKNLLFCYKNKGSGINHITGDIHYCVFVLPRKRTVLTIHDMVIVHFNKGLRRYLFFLFWYYLPCKWVKSVTCISEITKHDLITIGRCNPNKIKVIHNPLSQDFNFCFKPFNESCPVILHIGTRSNKNLERVVEALKGISCQLRIIGELSQNQLELLNENNVQFTNATDLTNDEIVKEYKLCDIVSFPSTFEGFGMPIIEAQATGRVILTSNIQPMLSIANDGAFFCNPYDVISIRTGFVSIIKDANLRNQLIELGKINVKSFSVDAIADSYICLYNELTRIEK